MLVAPYILLYTAGTVAVPPPPVSPEVDFLQLQTAIIKRDTKKTFIVI
jgi:hypothetical protein